MARKDILFGSIFGFISLSILFWTPGIYHKICVRMSGRAVSGLIFLCVILLVGMDQLAVQNGRRRSIVWIGAIIGCIIAFSIWALFNIHSIR